MVTAGAVGVAGLAIVGAYSVMAFVLCIMVVGFGLPIMLLADEHASWGGFGIMVAALLPGAAITVWAFINRDRLDNQISAWVKGHFPPAWTLGRAN